MSKAIVLAKVVSTGNILADGLVNATEITGLATVATSGSYNDLINQPSLTTTGITEGTNLYYTDARARAAISVSGSGSYNSSTGVITISGGVTSVNTLTGAVTLTTANITENTNLYYTDARARAAISVSGSGSYNSSTGVITISGGVTSVNTRTGAITITSSDVTSALGFTPISSLTPITLDTVNTRVGVNTASPQAALHVTGSIVATGDITTNYSDIRLKEILGPITDPLEKLKVIDTFYYKPNDLAKSFGIEDVINVGVSAQTIKTILPEIVRTSPINKDYLTVQYERLVPLLIAAIKQQQDEIDKLKNIIGV